MKFNFKKITSVLASAVMLGSTIGIAAAATYPAPFISGGAADVAVVVGADAASSDYLAAVDVGQSLQAELAKQTASGGTGVTTVTGEGVNLATSNTKLYFNDSIAKATSRATLDKTELPVLLADGTVTDDTGTDYDYTQKIGINAKYIIFGTSGNDIDDPTLYVDMGTAVANPVYNMTATFTKIINITHADVRGNTINLFGQAYTIGAGSDAGATTPSLVLYGAGETITLNEGEETTVTVGGVEYSVKVIGISSGEAVSVSVDGGTIKSIAEEASSKVGELNIYVKSSFYSAKESSQNYAELSLGSEKLTLNHGTTVKKGSEDKSIGKTYVDLGTSGDKLSRISIAVAAQKSKLDDIRLENSYTDPIFGSFKIDFAGISDGLKSDARDHIVIDTDNTANARVTFTTALADKEYTFNYVHDSDTDSTRARPVLADTANKTIRVLENETALEDDYIIVNSGDDGRILEVADVSVTDGGDPDDYVTFTDVLCSSNCDHKVTGNFSAGLQTLSIGGEDYNVYANNTVAASQVRMTWSSGGKLVLFPRIKLEKGGWVAFLKETALNTTTMVSKTFIVPSGYPTVTTDTLTWINTSASRTTTYANWNWTFTDTSVGNGTSNSSVLSGLDIDADGTIECNFSLMKGPSLLFIEEKKDGDTYGDGICVPLTTTGTTELAIDTAHFSDVSDAESTGFITWTSDTYKSGAVDAYCTYVEKDTSTGTNNQIEIYYPDEQVEMNVMLGAIESDMSVTQATGTVTELGSVTVSDSEVSSVQSKNLIVVGGSCINSVAAKLLGGSLCGADFATSTGVGADQFLIKVFANPYLAEDTTKVAMLVAGYNAADTTKAVKYATTEAITTDVDTELKKVTATYADVE